MSERYDNLSKIISPDTVQPMSELIALSALRKAHCYFGKLAPKLYPLICRPQQSAFFFRIILFIGAVQN